MTQFSIYLSKLRKSPLTEAIRALYESDINSSADEMFSTLVSYVKWSLTENWIHTVSDVRKYGTFMFQCNLDGIMPTLHVNFTRDTPMFADDPDVIEIGSNDPVLVQCYIKEMQGEDTTSMQQDVTDAIMKLLNDRKAYITSRLYEMSAEDITEQASMEPTTLLWKLDDILSNNYTPDYKQMPFTKFAKQYLEKPTEDALKELAEMIQFLGGTVTTENRSHSGGALKFNHYKKLAKLADDKKLTTAQVINYLSGVYSIGNYLGCSGVIQLNNGMIYSDGYVYDRDTVINSLKILYDSTFYEDAVEEWNDHDYRRESLMHELRGNRYPLPRQHRVHRLKNGEAPEYRTWVSTVDQSTGMRPIDTVLDQLKNNGNAKHIKPSKNLDLLISQSGTLPSVESSRKSATALYENTHADRAARVNKQLSAFLNDFRVEIEKFLRTKHAEGIQRLIERRVLNKRNLTDIERDQEINAIRTYEVVPFSSITLTCAGLKCILFFNGKNVMYNACCTRSNDIYINVYKCIDDASPEYANYDYDALFGDQPVEETENDRIYSNMYDNILKPCAEWNEILVTSQNIDDIIKALIDLSRSASLVDTLRHDLTHADQNSHPDQNTYSDDADYGRYMTKYMPSVYPSNASYLSKYHSIFPWEIDANIQERVTDIVKNDANASITDIAKEVYDWAVYKIKDLGLDTPERRKQCWQTAVALARAARYAIKEHGTVPQEWTGHSEEEQQSMSKIINHLGDYPV